MDCEVENSTKDGECREDRGSLLAGVELYTDVLEKMRFSNLGDVNRAKVWDEMLPDDRCAGLAIAGSSAG